MIDLWQQMKHKQSKEENIFKGTVNEGSVL